MIYFGKFLLFLFTFLIFIGFIFFIKDDILSFIESFKYFSLEVIFFITILFIPFFVYFLRDYYLLKKNSINRIVSKQQNSKDKTSLISDKEDLIDEDIVEPLFRILDTHKSKEFFSIALIGEWGSGKSSFLKTLENKLDSSDDFIIFNFNVWQLKNSENLLTEIYRSFDNLIYESNSFLWLKYFIKNIFINNYFNTLSKYLTRREMDISISLTPTLQHNKDDFETVLNRAIGSRRIVLMFDEVDRLIEKDDILNLFKAIKYFVSFESIISITALDIKRVEKQLDDINYTHKIFYLKYLMPKYDKSDFLKYYKDIVAIKLDDEKIIDKDKFMDFIKSIKNYEDKIQYSSEKIEKSILDIVNNFREIKNSYNDTLLICKVLSKNNKDWKDYISFEFIFVMNLIKAVDLEFFNYINSINTFNKLKDHFDEFALSQEDEYKPTLSLKKDLRKFESSKGLEIFKVFIFYLGSDLSQSIYIYNYYKIESFNFTKDDYKSFKDNLKNLNSKISEIGDNKDREKFIEFLYDRLIKDKDKDEDIDSFLKKITEDKENIGQNFFENLSLNILSKIKGKYIDNKEFIDIFKIILQRKSLSFEFFEKVYNVLPTNLDNYKLLKEVNKLIYENINNIEIIKENNNTTFYQDIAHLIVSSFRTSLSELVNFIEKDCDRTIDSFFDENKFEEKERYFNIDIDINNLTLKELIIKLMEYKNDQ